MSNISHNFKPELVVGQQIRSLADISNLPLKFNSLWNDTNNSIFNIFYRQLITARSCVLSLTHRFDDESFLSML